MSIAVERAGLFAQGLDIIQRDAWGARESYASRRRVTRPASWLFLHISVTIDGGDLPADEHEAMRTIERIGEERFGLGFPYNAAAFDTGRLYEGQPLQRRGAHTVNDKRNPRFPSGSLNYAARALVLPQMVTDDVTDPQLDAAARWGAALIRSGEARPGATWHGHREVAWKGCPGDAAYARLPELNALTRHYEHHGLIDPTTEPLTEEEDPMDLSRAEIVRGDQSAAWWLTDCATRQWIQNRAHAAILVQRGAKIAEGTGAMDDLDALVPIIWPQAAVDSIRIVGTAPPGVAA